MLAVSGKLDRTMGGPGFDLFRFKDDHSPVYDHTDLEQIHDPATYRRTVYRFTVRSVPNPFLDCLDCADPNQPTPVRNTTLTALQALALLNNPFMVRQAAHFAERLKAQSPDAGAAGRARRTAWRSAGRRRDEERAARGGARARARAGGGVPGAAQRERVRLRRLIATRCRAPLRSAACERGAATGHARLPSDDSWPADTDTVELCSRRQRDVPAGCRWRGGIDPAVRRGLSDRIQRGDRVSPMPFADPVPRPATSIPRHRLLCREVGLLACGYLTTADAAATVAIDATVRDDDVGMAGQRRPLQRSSGDRHVADAHALGACDDATTRSWDRLR